MRRFWLVAAAAVPLLTAGAQQPPQQPQQPQQAKQPQQQPSAGADPSQSGVLRVCGDPDNLPFSNQKQEGFENRIAALLARELGDTLVFTWWPQRRGFVRNTLRARECDVIVGVPGGFDPVLETKPYYRSTYYIVTRTDRKLRIASLDDPALRKLKIAVNLIGEDYTNPPPAHALGARGIPVVGYSTFYNAEHRPEDIVNAVADRKVDVAIVWGPLAGYFAKRASVPLTLVPLPDSVDRTGYPFAYDIAVGVRRSDKALKARIEDVLDRKREEIGAILQEYNVPSFARPK
jgi:mxaJ protein